jgi:hypothetical protein
MTGQRVLPTKGTVASFTSEWPYTCMRTFMSLQGMCKISVCHFHTDFIILLDALLCYRSFDKTDTPTSSLDLRRFRLRPLWKIVVKLCGEGTKLWRGWKGWVVEKIGQGGATEFVSNRSRYRAWQSHSVSIGI